MMRVAAIDIGTNSVLLLVAEPRGDDLTPIVERATVTRLGQDVDATRSLAPAAIGRTLACLAHYADEIRALGVDAVDAVGTSAMRDAQGGEDFIRRAQELLGVSPRVISGDEEARLTFAGALSGLGLAPGPVVVFDVGGGSTEVILGDADGTLSAAESLDIGSVRLTERHVRHDPIAADEITAVRAEARAALTRAPRALRRGDAGAPRVVGVAGTVTTLTAIARDIAPYDGARAHGTTLERGEIARVVTRLASLTLSERRALRALDPARADVIVAGGLLIEEVLSWASAAAMITSDRGVRWGVARGLAASLAP